jgi:hypothetical protein
MPFNPRIDNPGRATPPDAWAPKPSAPADKTAAPGQAPREDVGSGWGKPGK